ncbi:metal ABC transporter permease [Vibrio sp. D404a]|uniref:metal ABC transporter permease n=1 Tax=unclassified Vibrio TaxID=2614977 RepID=UPI00255236BE|nr:MULTISPECIES: metal ABC transporter permease [unclassified Vibrio]MDK9739048.1 metal ABC transporter permease [Vibrio sp. D404a]MDK9799582.1 metal ABC transporter permease [Vibrio sp. D449a]
MDLLLPFQFPFMQNAFLICLIVALPTALLSCFLVMKGWALMGDAVSHAVLPGIVLAYVTGLPLLLGAFLAGMLCSFLTGFLAENSRVKQDTVMGVVFSGMFALGIVLYVALDTHAHLDHILFGNMLGVDAQELSTAAIISAVVVLGIVLFWKDFLLHSFDEVQAKVSGLNVTVLHYTLLTFLSLTIVATLSAIGLILAISLLIAPGAIAFLLVKRFSSMLWIASVVNLTTMMLGAYLSFHIDSAPAPTIVLTQSLVFVLALVRRISITKKQSQKLHTTTA